MFCTATREAVELQARPFGSSLDSLLEQEILQLPRFSDDEEEDKDDEEWDDDDDEDWDDDDDEEWDDDDEDWDDEEEEADDEE